MIRLDDPAKFGAALQSMQLHAGLTATDIAGRVSCSRAHISNLRWGGFVPSFELLIELARALGYDLALIPREEA